ncbi:MAG: amidohydrolase family protein, partial [bacterium]
MKSGGIINATVVTMDSHNNIIRDGGILWKDSRIIGVGKSPEIESMAQEKNIYVESADNAVIFPGLVNTHTHLFQNLLKGLGADLNLESWWPQTIKPAAVNLRKEHVRAAAAGGMLESLRSGTTTVLDYMYALPVAGLSDFVIEQAKQLGIRLVYARGFRNTGAQYGFPTELIEKTEDVFDDVLRLRDLYEKDDGMLKIWVAPAAIWALDGAGLRDTRRFADEHGVPVTMHMYETDTDNIVCRERYGAR